MICKVKVLFEENNVLHKEYKKLLRQCTREKHHVGSEGKHASSVSAKVSEYFNNNFIISRELLIYIFCLELWFPGNFINFYGISDLYIVPWAC